MSVKSICSLISLLSFHLVDLPIDESEVLKSPILNVWGLMWDLSFSSVSFAYVGALVLKA